MSTLRGLFLAAGLCGVVAILTIGVGIYVTMQRALHQTESLEQVSAMEALALQIAPLAMEARFFESDRAYRQIVVAMDRIDAIERDLRSRELMLRAALDAVRTTLERLRDAARELQEGRDPPERVEGATLLRPVVVEQAEQLLFAATALHDLANRLKASGLERMRRALTEASLVALVGGAFVWFAMAWLAIAFKSRIFAPLDRARATLGEIGAGALDARVPVLRRDEIGAVGASINAMAENLQQVTASKSDLEAAIVRRERAETALRQRNARLEEINHELDRFAYVASHDLRAPLRGIRSLAGWIVEDAGENAGPDTQRHIKLLQSRLDRLDALLDALLQFNRIGRVTHEIEKVDLTELVEHVFDLYASDTTLRCAVDGPDATLATHRAPLELILRNLVGNAVKHHDRAEGLIRVIVEPLADRVKITVEDDGPGIPAKLQERVFRMFETLQPRDVVEGSGMGLAMIRKTARHYGSDVTVTSPLRDGRGCAFAFWWPRSVPAVGRADEAG